jgi:dihydroorotate dehydrogenase electron transfer subunit
MTPTAMHVEDGQVIAHERVGASYRILTLALPAITALARPGQFVHLRLAMLEDAVLRRPFSIYRVDGAHLSILYKSIGRGTAAMTDLHPGAVLSVIGPLGNGFPEPAAASLPVCVAGGYGVAPLSFFARRIGRPGVLFTGGAGGHDILCLEDFKALGWDIHVATEDGSMGERGLVTAPLDAWLAGRRDNLEFFACGPNGLLKAVGQRAMHGDWKAWLSIDRHMGCGVGACLACVQKIRKDGVEVLLRVCKEGPIFEARDVVWE